MRYQTVEVTNLNDLDREVNRELDAGWDLYGDLVALHRMRNDLDESESYAFIQPMIHHQD